ncbi:MAG: Transcriptional regulator, TrmB [Candidatus Magasanikbacteria bacterium GW2011_GWA2_46_17]|uniref:Transcriptional regulator, TrmB n=1 Tax=Candidatus Magasanikbacteria bacterium GW2011_GWA2_46_17 TaxID=1619042 RepID=A0A0G1P0V8_9BACT|nr:MAG: Transcriptional regulator, TrmB [Candidatus Magasanikbacteria bacterium GW2011_GWA2_46_17]
MIDTLKLFGIKEKPAQVYTALLTLGSSSVMDVAKKASLKRPMVYIYLEELLSDGFVQKITIGKKEYYQAVSPKFLETKLEQNLLQLKKEMPELELLHEQGQGRPKITIFEGEKGLNLVYEEISKTRELMFWSDLFAVEKLFPNIYRKINQATAEKKIYTREIIADTADARASARRWAATAGEHYDSRLATGPIYNDSVIYDNVVAMFRLQQQNLFVVRIEDPTIAITMKTIYEMAWLAAKPYKLTGSKNK